MRQLAKQCVGSIALALVLIIQVLSVQAQPADGSSFPGLKAQLDTLSRDITRLETQILSNIENDAELVSIRVELERAASNVPNTATRLQPRLGEINTRLEQLGPPPVDETFVELEAISQERIALLAERAEINALIGQAATVSNRARSQLQRIRRLRQDLFSRTLYKRHQFREALHGGLWDALAVESAKLVRLFSDWWQFVSSFKLPALLWASGLSLVAGLVLLVGGLRLFRRFIERDRDTGDPSYLSRLSVAFWSTFLPSVTVAAFFAIGFVLFDYFGVVRGDVAAIIRTLLFVLTTVFFLQRLANAILSPRLPNWQVLTTRPQAARTLVWLVSLMSLVIGVDYLLTTVSGVLGSPLSLSVAKHFFAAIAVGLLVVAVGLVKPFGDRADARPWPQWVRYTMFTIGGIPIVAALLGYIGLARFASQQIVITGAILTTMYIGYLSARAVSTEGAFAQTPFGRYLADRFGTSETRIDQIGLAISILIQLIVLLVGIPLVLLLWGFQPADIQAWVLRSAAEFKIGSISFSLIGLLTGLFVFGIGYFLTRRFQRWLDGSVMARGRVDSGVRNSIRVAIGYIGLALAAIIGVSAAGINLSNLALVAGALSVGIGFGLQNIVSNFVSGLILLAERPFKVGDWIVAGTVSGTVKKISVRATEIETFQRQTVILPNSELINSAVGNWTHRNKIARVEIPIGVAYGTDPDKVRSILLEIGKKHEHSLEIPGPQVLFMGFGDSSLDFELRLFVADTDYLLSIQSDTRFEITKAFAANDIEIPFPQRDVHLKLPEGFPAGKLPVAGAPSEAPPKPTSKRRKSKTPDPD